VAPPSAILNQRKEEAYMRQIKQSRRWLIGLLLSLGCLATIKFVLPLAASRVVAADEQSDSPEIIGGQEAAANAWPWQVALVDAKEKNAYKGIFCGGSLINAEWVLSAGHCTFNANGSDLAPASVDIVVGRHKLSSNTGQRIHVTQIIRHPSYRLIGNLTPDYDVALFHLAKPVNQATIALVDPTGNRLDLPNSDAVVSGWGLTVAGGDRSKLSDVLRQVSLPLVSYPACTLSWGIFFGSLTPREVCAGYLEGGKNACNGDSGGPLMVFDSQRNQWMQIGVVSWGSGDCAQPKSYGVFARVSSLSSWISEQIPTLATITPTPTNTPTATPTPTQTPTPLPTPTGTLTPSVMYVPAVRYQKFEKPLSNGSFESGNTAWTSYSFGDYNLIFSQSDANLKVAPHSGTTLAWLGGSPGEISVLEQTITIPEDKPVLNFWYWGASAQARCGYDFGGVVVNNTIVDQFDLCTSTNSSSWQPRGVDLSAYAGKLVTLQLRGENITGQPSSLYLDDITFAASALVSADGATAATNQADIAAQKPGGNPERLEQHVSQ
jgi:secreted trypsin-like serine protease